MAPDTRRAPSGSCASKRRASGSNSVESVPLLNLEEEIRENSVNIQGGQPQLVQEGKFQKIQFVQDSGKAQPVHRVSDPAHGGGDNSVTQDSLTREVQQEPSVSMIELEPKESIAEK